MIKRTPWTEQDEKTLLHIYNRMKIEEKINYKRLKREYKKITGIDRTIPALYTKISNLLGTEKDQTGELS